MPGPLPPHVKAKARALRSDGMPLKQIASRLGISPATVCGWCRDIVLSDDQIVAIHRAQAANADAGRVAQGRRCHADRAAAQAHGRRMARSGDPVHLAGCMLYWAEGAKNPNHVRLANTDAGMLQYFRLFLFRCYGVEDEEIRLTVNCFLNNGLSLDEIETWWRAQLELPAACLRKAAVNRPSRSSKGVRRRHVYGTASLTVHSTFIVQSIFGAIQEYAGFEQPEWVLSATARRAQADAVRMENATATGVDAFPGGSVAVSVAR